MKAEVVICTENSGAFLDDCLKSIKKKAPSGRIIIVDAGSKDNTIDIAKKHGCEIHVKPGLSFLGEARMFRFEKVRTKWCAEIDSDEILNKDWWAEISKHLENGDVAIECAIIS